MPKPSKIVHERISAWEGEQIQVWRTEKATTIAALMQAPYITAMSTSVSAGGLGNLVKFAVSTSKIPYETALNR
jgi:hypothetical protein